jgi:hypothetical protein
MQLPKETEDRIRADSKAYARKHGRKEIGYYSLNYEAGAKTEASRSLALLTTLESIKEDCKSKGIPMDLVLQSIYNKAEKAVKGYYEKEHLNQKK